jgi:pimeloyl-ACP methyl ester carboxylesterase
MAENPGRYQADSPAPERWNEFLANLRQMWTTGPNWTPDDMRFVQTPVLVLDGPEEEVIDIDHVRLLADLLPNGTLELMPGTGHFAMIDHPEAFARIVRDYLDREM